MRVLGFGARDTTASSGIGRPRARLEFVARLGAVALALPPAALAAPAIDELTVRPGYFTPDGDGLTDTAEISFVPGGAADSVVVRVEVRRDSDDALLDTLVPPALFPRDVPLVRTWAPAPIADGVYRFDVLVVDAADSAFASGTVVADTTDPQVTLGVLAPNPFDPASSPPADVLAVPFEVVSDSTTATVVRVLTSAGAAVDSLGVLNGPGTGQFGWDGRDAVNANAVSGFYRIRAIAIDLAGNADTTSQAFTLDREAPRIVGLADSVQTDAFPLLVSGSTVDLDRVTAVTISVDGGQTFFPVDIMTPPGPLVDWSTAVTFPATPGFYTFVVRAADALGHTGQQSVVVGYDTTIPVPSASTVLEGGTVADGGTVRIRTEWNLAGLDLGANFAQVDFGYEPGSETVVEGPPGTYTISHRVSPSNIEAAGVKAVVITASTGYVVGRDTVSVVLVDGGPRTGELVSVSRNRFDPDARETVAIAGARPFRGVTVDIYNLAGQRVRHLAGTGFVEWDGLGEGGKPCGSGVYILQVTVEDEAETRRVAIVRGGGS